jgi:hypothetical protein
VAKGVLQFHSAYTRAAPAYNYKQDFDVRFTKMEVVHSSETLVNTHATITQKTAISFMKIVVI